MDNHLQKIIDRFFSEVWTGEPSLSDKVSQQTEEGISLKLDDYIFCFYGDLRRGLFTIINTTNKWRFLSISTDEDFRRVFAHFCTDEEANEYLDFLITHKVEIINGLQHDPNFAYI